MNHTALNVNSYPQSPHWSLLRASDVFTKWNRPTTTKFTNLTNPDHMQPRAPINVWHKHLAEIPHKICINTIKTV